MSSRWQDAESTDEFRIVLCSVCVSPVRGVGPAFRTSFVPPPTQLPDDATTRSMPETLRCPNDAVGTGRCFGYYFFSSSCTVWRSAQPRGREQAIAGHSGLLRRAPFPRVALPWALLTTVRSNAAFPSNMKKSSLAPFPFPRTNGVRLY